MTKSTQTRKIRGFDFGTDDDGMPKIMRLKSGNLVPPDPRKKLLLECGVRNFEILVSEGQLINKRKMCKKLIKEHNKKNNV